MTYRIGVLLAVFVAACAPTLEPTPAFERAPSLAPSATVLPIAPQEDSESFVGRSDPTAAALAAEGHPSQDPPLAAQPTEQSIPITVIAEDGTVLSSRYFGAGTQSGSAIVLLHDENGDTASLMLLGASLQQAGFNVMVLSLRGYRPSAGQVDWTQAAGDALDGIESTLTLPGITQVALIGIGRSTTAAMQACARHPQCRAMILVNPVESITVDLGERPLLLLVDQNSQQTAQIIQAGAGDAGSLYVIPALAIDQIAVSTPLVDWLLQEFPE